MVKHHGYSLYGPLDSGRLIPGQSLCILMSCQGFKCSLILNIDIDMCFQQI